MKPLCDHCNGDITTADFVGVSCKGEHLCEVCFFGRYDSMDSDHEHFPSRTVSYSAPRAENLDECNCGAVRVTRHGGKPGEWELRKK